MPIIKQLSASVINKIAAGEVIERPASVVKELVENSLDAGAKRIDVLIEQGGTQLLRVVDDGCGISAEQLPLALASHATSKIDSAEDLFSVRTLGFRGEALASIAEVSRFLMRSRPHDANGGMEIEVVGGQARDLAPCGCPPGTTIEVRELFYNTPVRRKFLRTGPTEMGHAAEALTRLAIPHPQVHFTLQHNARLLHDLPATSDWRERLARFFGADLAENLIAVESEEGDVRLSGYVANPTHSRSNNKMQYLFLNGRFIRDRALHHALSEAYRGLLLTGRYPICFLQLEMPPEMVDVNVHPTKLEVRFQDGGGLYGQLLGTLRRKFLSTDLEARYQHGKPNDAHDATATVEQAVETRRGLADWAKNELARQAGSSPAQDMLPSAEQLHFRMETPTPPRAPLSLNRIDAPPIRTFATAQSVEAAIPRQPDGPRGQDGGDARDEQENGPHFHPARPALQVHNRYLVAESDDGMIVIDQHALHERIIYEQIREKVLAGAVETQNLLVPEPVDLAPAEAAAALEHRDLLGQLGLTVEAFGGDTVLVSSYPAMLANISPAEVLRDLVERLIEGGRTPERRDLLDSLLHSISCKAAIKAGDRLSAGEIEALIEQRHLAQDAHHCPHGRPTALIFTRDELDRQFKRI